MALALIFAVVWLGLLLFLRRPTFGHLPKIHQPVSSPEILRSHVETLAHGIPRRDADNPENLEQAAIYIAEQLRGVGVQPHSQEFPAAGASYRNIIASFGPTESALTVVGAHYDSFGMFGENPGADDNASGTAGLLELARLLVLSPPPTPVELVFFANEEPPFFASEHMGSAVHASSLKMRGRQVRGMICLEMIGYFTEDQPWPNWLFRSLFPNRGDFIAVAGHASDTFLIHHLKRAFQASSFVPAVGITAPNWLAGVDASDHRSYWNEGYPAVLVTDTAFVRNPHYHTAGDTADTLDYERMASVVEGVHRAVLEVP